MATSHAGGVASRGAQPAVWPCARTHVWVGQACSRLRVSVGWHLPCFRAAEMELSSSSSVRTYAAPTGARFWALPGW
eukprot:scaffold1456_cov392-Prasinococcus_capsulatus_cf.AAC.10